VKLTITTEGDFKDETPAQKHKRQQEERQRAAEDAIQKDANVQALVDTFDATIDTKSIKPAD
jgi:hypothetical protein